jgi:CheY-like chemotaxis protein
MIFFVYDSRISTNNNHMKQNPSSQLKILIGDDSAEFRFMFSKFFPRHQFTVVSTPAELINAAGEGEFDVIVSDFDYGMAVNGLEALCEIGSTSRHFDTPKIIWSGSVFGSDSREDFANNKIQFVPKGSLKDLVQLVESVGVAEKAWF